MIKSWLKLVLLFALSCAPLFAQSVTVTGQATDSDGQQWVNGTYQVSLVLPTGATGYYNVNTGFPFLASFGGSLDGTGSFSVTLTPTSVIRPVGTFWKFVICPQVLGAACGVIELPINSSQSITTQIGNSIQAPRVTGGPGVYAYSDIEVQAFPNNSYFNVISQQNRCYATSWTVCQSGGGAGVSSLNTLTGALLLAAGSNISINTSGSTITIGCPTCAYITSITTTGSSGPSTVIGGVLNIPQYAGGGSGAFSGLTGGTNTTASMLVGTGASLGPTGSGVVTANAYSGAATGSGAVVLASSATLTAPNLGTPTAINLANATNLPWTALTGTPTCAQVSVQSLTTTGTSGAATLNGSTCVLNIPVYSPTNPAFQANGVALTGQTTINFINSAATNGLTLTFANPAAGNVQLGFTGQLTNAGLANPAVTVNGQSCTLGASCNIPIQINSSANASQAGVNFLTSTANVVGLTVTPVNSATNQVKFEINGTSYAGNALTASNLSGCTGSTAGDVCVFNGSSWARLAGNTSGTQYLQETSVGVPSWSAGTSSVAWSALANPATTLSLTMGNSDTTTFTFGSATSTNTMFKWVDTASNTGTGILGRFTTAASSAATPWQADANGTGWQVNSSGQLVSVGGSLGSSTIAMSGSTSGTITLTVPAIAGTATVTWGNGSGTPAITASAPLAISATTGNISVTGLAGGVLAGSTPAFTATPVLGASGTLGSLGFGNATSGTVTLQTVTGALGSVTASLPANTGTIAELNLAQTFSAVQTISASNGLVLSAMTGTQCLEEVSGVVTATGSACGAGGGTTFQVNGAGLTSSTTVNFENSSATNGITVSFSNPSVGNVQLGIGGTLAIAGGGTNAVSAAAGTVPNASSSTAAAWTPTLTLGASGTLGSVTMGNASTGTVTIQPVTGALGTVTASLPANTGTIAELNLAQTFSAVQTISASNGLVLSAMTGTSCLEEVSGVVTATGSGCGGGGTTTNAVTFNNGGSGASSGTTFNGGSAVTISYNTIGAAPLLSPSFTTPALGAATATSLLATGIVDGEAPVTITTGSTATLGGTYNSGYTINHEATAATGVTYTLPTAALGKQYCVKNGNNGSAADTGVLTLQVSAAGQSIVYNGTAGASNGNLVSGGAAGDAACVVGISTTQWEAYVQTGTWAVH